MLFIGAQTLQVAVDCKMAMDVEDYATSFRPDIIDAVSGWCQGATFAKILTLTDVFEVRARCSDNVSSIGVALETMYHCTSFGGWKCCYPPQTCRHVQRQQ